MIVQPVKKNYKEKRHKVSKIAMFTLVSLIIGNNFYGFQPPMSHDLKGLK